MCETGAVQHHRSQNQPLPLKSAIKHEWRAERSNIKEVNRVSRHILTPLFDQRKMNHCYLACQNPIFFGLDFTQCSKPLTFEVRLPLFFESESESDVMCNQVWCPIPIICALLFTHPNAHT